MIQKDARIEGLPQSPGLYKLWRGEEDLGTFPVLAGGGGGPWEDLGREPDGPRLLRALPDGVTHHARVA